LNTANLLAWLTCLILAFFACVLGVRNAYVALGIERRVERMQEQYEAPRGDQERLARELRRMRQSLAHIAEELQALRDSEGADAPPELEQRIEELQELIRRVDAALAEAEAQEG
jgi:chromosome segregation ATPase